MGEAAHDEENPAGRSLQREHERVPLTRHEALLMCDGKFWHDHLDVYLSRWQGGSPELWLHHVGTIAEIRMTETVGGSVQQSVRSNRGSNMSIRFTMASRG